MRRLSGRRNGRRRYAPVIVSVMSTIINILPGWSIAILLFGLFWIASVLGSRWR